MPQTLPQALLRQAHTRGSAIALRFKRLGQCLGHGGILRQYAKAIARVMPED